MSPTRDQLNRASQAAFKLLESKTDCFEVFVRWGETQKLVRTGPQSSQKVKTFEFGVACRCQHARLGGFGAASGSAQLAGEAAARLALMSLTDGHPPLPSCDKLGAVSTPEPQWVSDEALEEQFAELSSIFGEAFSLTVVRSRTLFRRSEGFHGSWGNQLVLVEWTQELSPGVRGTFHRVLPPPWRFVPPSFQHLLPRSSPGPSLPAGHHLGRVVLSPDLAAPLLVSLARSKLPTHAVASSSWELWDLRTGSKAFLPMACDGEGLPSQNRPLLGHLNPPKDLYHAPQPKTHPIANPGDGLAAIRVPWDSPPKPAPVHLWQAKKTEGSLSEALASLERAFVAVAPVSEIALESNGQFRLLAFLIQFSHGRPQSWGLGVLRGSLKRLLQGLMGTWGEQEHLGLGCVVSTPWLLVSNLEVIV